MSSLPPPPPADALLCFFLGRVNPPFSMNLLTFELLIYSFNNIARHGSENFTSINSLNSYDSAS